MEPNEADIVVSDAGPIIHLDELRCLDLFQGSQPYAGIFLTDDAAARLAAESLQMKVHGTVGLIIRSERIRLRSRAAVLDILRSIPTSSSLHISGSLLEAVISRMEASPVE